MIIVALHSCEFVVGDRVPWNNGLQAKKSYRPARLRQVLLKACKVDVEIGPPLRAS
jgi:hypothetical protein